MNQLVELEQSDDPEDVERAKRLSAPMLETLRKATQGLVKLPKVDFGFARLQAYQGLGEQWRQQQEELERSMHEVAAAQAERQARQAEAEDATIEGAQLLSSLVSLASAQSAQLALMSTLLEAVASQAGAAAELEEQRWRRTWPVMVWTLVAGGLAALGALGAIVVTLVVAA